MSGNVARRVYDKAERDRQHALRRIQRPRTVSIAVWLVLPVLMVFVGIGLFAAWVWQAN